MSAAQESQDFPRLTPENHRQTSPESLRYNCIAWATGDTAHWWQPGVYWPGDSPVDPAEFGINSLVKLFKALGYQDGGMNVDLEPGIEKVALFADSQFYTHAARQLPTGRWTSKLGKAEDIEHDAPGDVAGGVYGEIVHVMSRQLVANR